MEPQRHERHREPKTKKFSPRRHEGHEEPYGCALRALKSSFVLFVSFVSSWFTFFFSGSLCLCCEFSFRLEERAVILDQVLDHGLVEALALLRPRLVAGRQLLGAEGIG